MDDFARVMPGVQKKLNTTKMREYIVPERIEEQPILNPTILTLISEQRVSMYYNIVAPADILNVIVWEHSES